MKKERLDSLLVQKRWFATVEQARRAIMAGQVKVDNVFALQSGSKVNTNAQIEVKKPIHPYVGRGGLKLAKAIETFSLSLHNRVVLDIGASTGGFTDCALQHGAKKVFAIDVGYGQLAWRLRQDARVVVLERTNFRHMDPSILSASIPEFAMIDVSFISLGQILPKLHELFAPKGEVVALVKPQFEAKREQVEDKGLVHNPSVHVEVLTRVGQMIQDAGFELKGLTHSPIQGNAGNIEFLAYLLHQSPTSETDWNEIIQQVVEEAHREAGKQSNL